MQSDSAELRRPLGPGPGEQSRLGQLREATRAQHQHVESLFTGIGSFCSLDGYHRHLAVMVPLYEQLEASLEAARVADVLHDWPMRRKAHLARQDLAALGGRPAALGRLDLPPIEGTGAVLGTAYVLEGATLGSAVLARQMLPLGIGPGHGGALLSAYGAARGAMWQRFLAVVQDTPLDAAQEDAMVAAARGTFALFAQCASAMADQARGALARTIA